jgi:hypothetical protein
MREIGFWDYTCPGNGSLEEYTCDEWDVLLDDMAAGEVNSLVLCVKWLTTGYRSCYPWLDQDPRCSAIASDNAVVHHALQGARGRGMRTWLLVVASIFDTQAFGLPPTHPGATWGAYGQYDPDLPGVDARMVALCEEITDLFGAEADGMVIELETCDGAGEHRVPLYNAWAAEYNRPDFDAISRITLEPRSYPFLDWRDFTTDRRAVMLTRLESAIRARGFAGELSTIVEVGNADGVLVRNVNLERLARALPGWSLTTYDSIYDRRINRLSSMDFCVVQPHALGCAVNYLTRGVMTFGANWEEHTDNLDDQWRMSIEDALAFPPERFWFMGADARTDDGLVCNRAKLPAWGYPDGCAARLALMRMLREMGAVPF